MYAIIESGGKQFQVSPGQEVQLEKLGAEVGDTVEFDRVLAVSTEDGQMLAGDEAREVKVTGEVTANGRGKKIIVYKFKRRKMYRRKQGHRQDYTQVKIADFAGLSGASSSDAASSSEESAGAAEEKED